MPREGGNPILPTNRELHEEAPDEALMPGKKGELGLRKDKELYASIANDPQSVHGDGGQGVSLNATVGKILNMCKERYPHYEMTPMRHVFGLFSDYTPTGPGDIPEFKLRRVQGIIRLLSLRYRLNLFPSTNKVYGCSFENVLKLIYCAARDPEAGDNIDVALIYGCHDALYSYEDEEALLNNETLSEKRVRFCFYFYRVLFPAAAFLGGGYGLYTATSLQLVSLLSIAAALGVAGFLFALLCNYVVWLFKSMQVLSKASCFSGTINFLVLGIINVGHPCALPSQTPELIGELFRSFLKEHIPSVLRSDQVANDNYQITNEQEYLDALARNSVKPLLKADAVEALASAGYDTKNINGQMDDIFESAYEYSLSYDEFVRAPT